MIKTLWARAHHGHRTIGFPKDEPKLPERFRGLPAIDHAKCPAECHACESACPTAALSKHSALKLDLGKCLFCAECTRTCPTGAIQFSNDYRLSTRNRDELVYDGHDGRVLSLAKQLEEKSLKLFGRSLKLRQVSAGGCNGCEVDVNVLGTIVFDLGRFGVQFVASPRHADGLLITGPVTENMKLALQKTYEAVAEPKLVIAVGACAISGGPFAGNPQTLGGAESVVPVDLYIPGCPPHPITTLDGILRLLNKRAQ